MFFIKFTQNKKLKYLRPDHEPVWSPPQIQQARGLTSCSTFHILIKSQSGVSLFSLLKISPFPTF